MYELLSGHIARMRHDVNFGGFHFSKGVVWCEIMLNLLALLLAVVGLSACASHPATDTAAGYSAAQSSMKAVVLSPEQEAEAVLRFKKFYKEVTATTVREQIAGLYAEDVWFNDSLKTLHGRAAVQDYFLKTLEHAEVFQTQVDDVARSGSNYYVRWTMDVRFKGSKETIRTIGISHLGFDSSGHVILHQDFWDSTSGFFEHLPVIGGAIRWVKSLL